MDVLVINCSPVRDGATAGIVKIVSEELRERHTVRSICIDDYSFGFCKGCRSCHQTAVCVQDDDFTRIIGEFEDADIIVAVSPSYWADVPGQFKAFIDRCTPWCNTHEPHASLPVGKKGYSIALRTGPGMHECEKIIQTIEHFYGHMEIEASGSLGLCGVEYKSDVEQYIEKITDLCNKI